MLRVWHENKRRDAAAFQRLRDRLAAPARVSGDEKIIRSVRQIVRDVQRRGPAAVIAYTKKYDRHALNRRNYRVSAAAIRSGYRATPLPIRRAMKQAIANVTAYQRHVLIKAPPPLKRGGATLGRARSAGLRGPPLEL